MSQWFCRCLSFAPFFNGFSSFALVCGCVFFLLYTVSSQPNEAHDFPHKKRAKAHKKDYAVTFLVQVF